MQIVTAHDGIKLLGALEARLDMAANVVPAFSALDGNVGIIGPGLRDSRNTDIDSRSRDRVRVSKRSTRLGTSGASF